MDVFVDDRRGFLPVGVLCGIRHVGAIMRMLVLVLVSMYMFVLVVMS
jgi:hypothetical protein